MSKQRLIDANKIKFCGLNKCICPDLTAQDVIDDAPTVDAVPVVRGEWSNIPNRYVCVAGDRPYRGNATSCSVCHDINPNAFKTNYCPNCGAKMEVEHDG